MQDELENGSGITNLSQLLYHGRLVCHQPAGMTNDVVLLVCSKQPPCCTLTICLACLLGCFGEMIVFVKYFSQKDNLS